MLTDSENAWLADRKKDRLFVCRFCPGKEYGREMTDTGVPCVCHCMSLHIRPECYKLHKGTGWDDAAVFEARVAAKLAKMMLEHNRYPCRGGSPQLGCMRDWSNLTGPMAVHCEDCILREVRLQVEEEMDADEE